MEDFILRRPVSLSYCACRPEHPVIAEHQCCSPTIAKQHPPSRRLTACSIFLPIAEWAQSRLPSSPRTRNDVSLVGWLWINPPRRTTDSSQALRGPNLNFPVKQKRRLENTIVGGGSSRGNVAL